MRRLLACALLGCLTAGATPAQPSPLPPALPTAQPTAVPPPAPAMGTSGVPIDPSKVAWPTEVNGKTISAVILDLRSADPSVQEAALRAVPLFGLEAARKAAMRQVLAVTDDGDPGVRTKAVILVGVVGFDNAKDFGEAVAKLGALVTKSAKGGVLRLHATRSLANLGPDAHPAVPALCSVTDDPSWEIRAAVADALGKLGAAAYEQTTVVEGPTTMKVPTLKRESSRMAMQKLSFVLIKDPSSAVRMEACQALIVLGPPYSADPAKYQSISQPFIDAIASRLRLEKEPIVKVWLNLLHMMYDERVFDATLKLLVADVNSTDTAIRLQAMSALNVLGPKSLPALEAVARALRGGDTAVQVVAIQTMVSMGEFSAQTVLPELERFVAETPADAKHADIRAYAEAGAKSLRKNKPAPALPAVAKP